MLTLDGSHGEGGGSLVRTALALSALTGQPFRVNNIRAGRKEPGLKAQHLHAIKALKKICSAETNEIELGSSELQFTPGKVQGGVYTIDIGTAGSITLLLQALILPCLFAPKKVTLHVHGGTSGKWQASADYLQNIVLPHLQRFVEGIELRILKRGYYPKGGGEIELKITPRFFRGDFESFQGFWQDLRQRCSRIALAEQGTLQQVKGIINLSQELQEKSVAERIRRSALHELQPLKVPLNVRLEHAASASTGGEVLLWGVFSGKENSAGRSGNEHTDYDNPVLLGSDVLLEPGKRSEALGKEVAEKLMEEIASGAAADAHLADQLIMFMGLLPGSEIVCSRVTNHALTNMHVVERFLPVKFAVEGKKISVNAL